MVELYLEQHPVMVHVEEVFSDARAGTLALGVGLVGLVTVPPTPDMAQLYTTARPSGVASILQTSCLRLEQHEFLEVFLFIYNCLYCVREQNMEYYIS